MPQVDRHILRRVPDIFISGRDLLERSLTWKVSIGSIGVFSSENLDIVLGCTPAGGEAGNATSKSQLGTSGGRSHVRDSHQSLPDLVLWIQQTSRYRRHSRSSCPLHRLLRGLPVLSVLDYEETGFK